MESEMDVNWARYIAVSLDISRGKKLSCASRMAERDTLRAPANAMESPPVRPITATGTPAARAASAMSAPLAEVRAEERRVGTECVSTCHVGWSAEYSNNTSRGYNGDLKHNQ